jgi:hypothetical protein
MGELFRNEERDRDEARRLAAIRRENRVNLKALFLTLAIVIAPFVALIVSVELALGVLAAGLLFSTWLTWIGANQAGPIPRSRLQVMAVLNLVLCLVVVLILVLRLRA